MTNGAHMDLINAAAERDQLRGEFPGWGIFHDPYAARWFAVPGHGEPLVAGTPEELRRRLLGILSAPGGVPASAGDSYGAGVR